MLLWYTFGSSSHFLPLEDLWIILSLSNGCFHYLQKSCCTKSTRGIWVFCVVHFPSVSVCWWPISWEAPSLSGSFGIFVNCVIDILALSPCWDQVAKSCSSLVWVHWFLLRCKIYWASMRPSQEFQGVLRIWTGWIRKWGHAQSWESIKVPLQGGNTKVREFWRWEYKRQWPWMKGGDIRVGLLESMFQGERSYWSWCLSAEVLGEVWENTAEWKRIKDKHWSRSVLPAAYIEVIVTQGGGVRPGSGSIRAALRGRWRWLVNVKEALFGEK